MSQQAQMLACVDLLLDRLLAVKPPLHPVPLVLVKRVRRASMPSIDRLRMSDITRQSENEKMKMCDERQEEDSF